MEAVGELGALLNAAARGISLPETDAEIVELCRVEMQGVIDRTDWSKTGEDLMNSPGLPHRWVRIIAADLTEIGHFTVDLPPEATRRYSMVLALSLRRHWVYRQKDGQIITLQLSRRRQLEDRGYVDCRGFVNNLSERN